MHTVTAYHSNESGALGEPPRRCIAFEGYRCLAAGELVEVARKTKAAMERGEQAPIIIFDEVTSRLIEIDFRGTVTEVVARLTPPYKAAPQATASTLPEQRGPGRPKLGVVAHEVTLLPRHWDWLNSQPGGASVALRKLVEDARRANQAKDRARHAQEAVHRFMYALAGNLPDFEEASRAFYARNTARFDELIEPWPKDIRNHLKKLVATAIHEEATAYEVQK